MANYRNNPDKKIDLQVFRERLSQLMEARGFNQAEFAQAVGISTTSLCRYFQDRGPDVFALIQIADYCDVSVDWLLGRKQSKHETLTESNRRLIDTYSVASTSDKSIIDAILKKYEQ